MTPKCVPEVVASSPLNRRSNTETACELRKAGGQPLTLVSVHSGLLCFWVVPPDVMLAPAALAIV